MMKKFVSMFLALAMCLSLAATAFAAEEETETVNEPAVQTEVEAQIEAETPTEGEAAVQSGEAHTHIYYPSDYKGVDPDNYTDTTHVYIISGHLHKCSCGKQFIEPEEWIDKPHLLNPTGHSMIYDNGDGIVTIPLYACSLCNYTGPSYE